MPRRHGPCAASSPVASCTRPVVRAAPEAPMPSRRRAILITLLCIAVGALALNLAIGVRRPMHVAIGQRVLVFDVPGEVDEGPPPPTLTLDLLRREKPTF